MHEIQKLRRSINVVDAKVSYLREGFDQREKAVKEMNSDFDVFINVCKRSN